MPATNLNLNIVPSLTIEQIQLVYALVSATIPNLKSFIMSFDTAMMMDYTYQINSDSKSGRSTFGQRSSRKASTAMKANRNSGISTQDEFIGRLRPDLDRVEHSTDIHHVDDLEAQSEDLPTESGRGIHWRV